jgi:hypothetical protein
MLRTAASPLEGFGSIVFAQLRYLVQNINKKNQKASVSEISHLLWLYGESAFIYLLCCLLEEIDFRDPKLQKDQLKAQLLAQEFAKLASKPNFVTLFCEVLGKAALPVQLQEDFLHAVAKAVKATTAQQLSMGLALAQCGDTALRAEGAKFLRTRLNELTQPQPGSKEAVASLPEDLGHSLVFFLERQEGFAKQRAALMKLLQHIHPAERMPLALLPLMHAVDTEATELNSRLAYETARATGASGGGAGFPAAPLPASGPELAALMQDLGYSCCANAKCLGEVLGQFGPLEPACVGHLVGMLASTVHSLDDSLSLYSAFSTAVTGKYLEFDAKCVPDPPPLRCPAQPRSRNSPAPGLNQQQQQRQHQQQQQQQQQQHHHHHHHPPAKGAAPPPPPPPATPATPATLARPRPHLALLAPRPAPYALACQVRRRQGGGGRAGADGVERRGVRGGRA